MTLLGWYFKHFQQSHKFKHLIIYCFEQFLQEEEQRLIPHLRVVQLHPEEGRFIEDLPFRSLIYHLISYVTTTLEHLKKNLEHCN